MSNKKEEIQDRLDKVHSQISDLIMSNASNKTRIAILEKENSELTDKINELTKYCDELNAR